MTVRVVAKGSIAFVCVIALASCSGSGILGGSGSSKRTVSRAEPESVRQAALPSQPSRVMPPQERAPSAAAPTHPLAGLSPEALKGQWGEPTLTRTDGTAQTWQFAGANCTVLAYLYPADGGTLLTRYVEARPGGDSEAAIQACLKGGARASAKAGSAPKDDATRAHPKLKLKPSS